MIYHGIIEPLFPVEKNQKEGLCYTISPIHGETVSLLVVVSIICADIAF